MATTMRDTIANDNKQDNDVTTMATILFLQATTNLGRMHSWQWGGWVISTVMMTMRMTINDDDDEDDNDGDDNEGDHHQ